MTKILIGIVVVALGFAIFVATRPSQMHVERSITVNAPVDVTYEQVADFHKWAAWSPWDKLNPTMTKTYAGAPSGEGARYAWTGNKNVGAGEMTIKNTKPGERIDIDLVFMKPYAATDQTSFLFKQGASDETVVTWSMDGVNDFMTKAAGVFMNMDKMVGDDLEKGLAGLKTAAEADAKRRAEEAAKAAAKTAAAAPTPPEEKAPVAPKK